jgi:hypothetical protein
MEKSFLSDPSESVLPPRMRLHTDVERAQQRLHADCLAYTGVDPSDGISLQQSDYAQVKMDLHSVDLATGDAVKIDFIGFVDKENIFREVSLELFEDGSPYVPNTDIEALKILGENPAGISNRYMLVTSPELPPCLVNDQLDAIVSGRLGGKKGRRDRASFYETMLFLQEKGWVHYLSDQECNDVGAILSQLEPDYEKFLEDREITIEDQNKSLN